MFPELYLPVSIVRSSFAKLCCELVTKIHSIMHQKLDGDEPQGKGDKGCPLKGATGDKGVFGDF